jgi:hypothetical protein
MIERHMHRGHEICVQLLEVAPRQIRWVWKIDGVHAFKSDCTLPTAEVARSEALMYAQITIARLEDAMHPAD